MSWLANLAYVIAAVLYAPVLAYQMMFQAKNRRGWRQRFGHLALKPPQRRRVWLHAVSLGEVNATPLLVRQLETRIRDVEVVISSTTDTGYGRACTLYGPERVFRYPLDFSWVVRRVLRAVRPSLIVLVELEVWFNLVRLAHAEGIPIAVVNGRLTTRSAARLRRLGGAARSMFQNLSWVGAQDEETAERFASLGVPPDRLEVVGSLKWDTACLTDRVDGADRLAAAMGIDPCRPLWVCGSTGPGEEEMILDVHEKLRAVGTAPALAIVPRKPERFDEVAAIIERRGLRCVRRSARPDQPTVGSEAGGAQGTGKSERGDDAVLLGDTMGELRKFYSLAGVVLVARSLVPLGGSDPMEVAALAKPVLLGPHTDNFREPVRALLDGGAARICTTKADLAREVEHFCSDPDLAAEHGLRAQEVVRRHQGATVRTVEQLLALL